MADYGEPQWRTVQHLARDLMLAQESGEGRGRAVFLVGAGCSVSAGIPPASGISRRVALHLAKVYSGGSFTGTDPVCDADDALSLLVTKKHVEASVAYPASDGVADWGGLYQYFFAEHLKSPNQQRELVFGLIKEAEEKLNWAHACLGELVARQYVHTVLTPNFDQLVLAGIIRTGIIPVVADGLFALNRIVAEPLVPQVIHLHGSMHTYALRNDPQALAEPFNDHQAITMLNGVLQRANVLVVVGYAGGEEGFMDLLLQASRALPQLVIYWVTYEDDSNKLTPKSRALLSGENKFAIMGGEADRFFGDLMKELGIGQPAWVADPIRELHRHRVELVASASVEEASTLIRSYCAKIEAASQAESPVEDATETAAELRAAGEYAKARAKLENVDVSDNTTAARLHALNALSTFEESPESARDMLDAAISEFEALIQKTEGREKLDNILSLIDALFDRFEYSDAGGDEEALQRIVATATEWLDTLGQEADTPGRGRLLFYRALARHRQADANGEDVEGLQLAVEDYRAAITALGRVPDRMISVAEVAEELAPALQVIGRKNKSPADVREAIKLFHEAVEQSPRDTTQPRDEGGLLFNLSGALLDLLPLTDEQEAQALAREAASLLARAERAYERAGERDRIAEVHSRLEKLEPYTG